MGEGMETKVVSLGKTVMSTDTMIRGRGRGAISTGEVSGDETNTLKGDSNGCRIIGVARGG